MSYRIATVSDRPDLAPIVAAWLVNAFGHPGGRTVEEVTSLILAPPRGPEESFVLLDQDQPVGTASLAHDDLASRRDLTPWLAGVLRRAIVSGAGLRDRAGAAGGGVRVERLCDQPMALYLVGRTVVRAAWLAPCGIGEGQGSGSRADGARLGQLVLSGFAPICRVRSACGAGVPSLAHQESGCVPTP